LTIYHTQLIEVEAELAHFFEQQSLQDSPRSWIVLPSELIYKSRHVEVANKLGRIVHGEPSGHPKS